MSRTGDDVDVTGQGQLLNVLRLLAELVEHPERRLLADDELRTLEQARSLLQSVHSAAQGRFRAALERETT